MDIKKDKQYNISSSKFKMLSSTSGIGAVVTTKWGGFIMPLSINDWYFIKVLSESINDKDKEKWKNSKHQEDTGVEIVDDDRFIKFLQAKKGFQNLRCFAAIPHVSLSLSNFISYKEHPLYKEHLQLKRSELTEDMFYIPAIDFPKWFTSSKSELKHINEWYDLWRNEKFTRDGKEYRGHNDGKTEYFAPPRDPHGVTHVKHYKEQLTDPYVYKMLTPVPLVLICPNGHISDIPWNKFFCAKLDGKRIDDENGFDLFNYPHKGHCNGQDHNLKWIVNRNQSESWGTLKCRRCEKTVSLSGIMNIKPYCIGEKPWEPEQGHGAWSSSREICGTAANRTIMRVAMVTSNSIYFALTQSSLYVPIGWTSQNRVQLQGDADYELQNINNLYTYKLRDNSALTKEDFLNNFDILQHARGQGLRISEEECNAIKNEFLGISNDVDVVKTYRLEEYNVFVNNDRTPTLNRKFDFHDIDLTEIKKEYLRNKFLKIKQVPMLAITSTQLGFSRVNMPLPKIEKGQVTYPTEKIRPIYSGNVNDVRVLPANQIYGEGLFFAFDNNSINNWANKKYNIDDKDQSLEQYYFTKLEPGSMYEFLSQEMNMYGRAKFYLLHTFAHLLMKELEFKCGYPTASLSERLYYSDEMCGVLIYTADGAEGSMGGLVWQGQPHLIEETILSALQRATDCSSDPMCWENSDGLNKAACFSCAMVSETSCEHGNMGLDRRALVDPIFGFFRDLL